MDDLDDLDRGSAKRDRTARLMRVARLLARHGGHVRIGSRQKDRAEAARCPVPLDAGGANGGRGWSIETTVARTMISATGTSQLLGLPPEQEQASACNAHNVNAAAIKPIRNHIDC